LKVFGFKNGFDDPCSFDKLLMIVLKVFLPLKLYLFVNGSKEDQDGESKMFDQYAYYLEEILVYLKTVDFFDE
jgi:hypothetical protein